MNKLEQLKTMTKVVADTGDIDAIEQYHPEDATTNPSLLLKAAQMPRYETLLTRSLAAAADGNLSGSEQLAGCMDEFAVQIGCEILKIVPGLVSTEIDARLSFDTEATVARGKQILARYERHGVDPSRVLLKIASTWEGIEAARILEQQGIHCNLTLLFGFPQAVAAAEAGAFLISPFVGRILDWHKKATGQTEYPPLQDPGVISVSRIYRYYKDHGYDTIVMGASFRNAGEIEALAGCDRLTIAPALLEELSQDNEPLTQRLFVQASDQAEPRQASDEKLFRFHMNADAMATEKLAEGIRNFIIDQEKLEQAMASLQK